MMKRIAVLLLVLASLPVHAVEPAQNQRLYMPLQLPQEEGPWYRVELPVSLYWSARYADFRDLTVINSEGQPVAYSLLTTVDEPRRESTWHAARLFPLYAKAGQSSVPAVRLQRGENGTLIELAETEPNPQADRLRGWVVDASAIEAPLVELMLDWQGGDEGFHRFTLEASDDLQNWQPWGEGNVATLSSQGQKIVQRSVTLPGKSAHYLRLLWQEPQEALPLTGARIASRAQQTRAPSLQWSQALVPSRVDDHSLFWQLPLAMPITRVQVELEGDNVLMPVKLFSVAADSQPGHERLLAEGVLSRIDQAGQVAVNDQLQLPGGPVQALRLDVDRHVARPAAVPLKVALQPRQLVFLAQGSGPFAIVLDAGQDASRALPIDTLIPGYRSEQFARLPLALALEKQAIIHAPAPVAAVEPTVDWKRYGLWAVLVIGVMALGLMARSLLKQSRSSE